MAALLSVAAFAPEMPAVAQAQTLTNPNPVKHASPTTPQQRKSLKPCPTYGPGFVQVPGSDLCIKIGGSVQGDVTVGR